MEVLDHLRDTFPAEGKKKIYMLHAIQAVLKTFPIEWFSFHFCPNKKLIC